MFKQGATATYLGFSLKIIALLYLKKGWSYRAEIQNLSLNGDTGTRESAWWKSHTRYGVKSHKTSFLLDVFFYLNIHSKMANNFYWAFSVFRPFWYLQYRVSCIVALLENLHMCAMCYNSKTEIAQLYGSTWIAHSGELWLFGLKGLRKVLTLLGLPLKWQKSNFKM